MKVTVCDSILRDFGTHGFGTCGVPSWVLSSLIYHFRALRLIPARCSPPAMVMISSSSIGGGISSCSGAWAPRAYPYGACPSQPALLSFRGWWSLQFLTYCLRYPREIRPSISSFKCLHSSIVWSSSQWYEQYFDMSSRARFLFRCSTLRKGTAVSLVVIILSRV